MPMYRITWELEAIEAETPQDAARIALEVQRDPNSEATFFDVADMDGGGVAHAVNAAPEAVA